MKKHLQPSKIRNAGAIDASYGANKMVLATKLEQIQETASLQNALPNASQKPKGSLQITTDDVFSDVKVVEPEREATQLAAPESVVTATSPFVEPKKHNHRLAAMSALKKRQRQKVTSNKLGEWIKEEDIDESLLEEDEDEEIPQVAAPPGRQPGRKNSGGSAKLNSTPPNNCNKNNNGGGDSVVKRVQAMAAELCAGIDEIVMPESAPRPMGPSLRQQLAESWEGMSYYDRLRNIAGHGNDEGEGGSAGAKAKQQAKLRQKGLGAGDDLGLDVGLAGSGSKLHNNNNNNNNTKAHAHAHIINKMSHEDLSRFMSRAIVKSQATDSNDYNTRVTPKQHNSSTVPPTYQSQPGSNNNKPRTTASSNPSTKQPSPAVAAAASKAPLAPQPVNGQKQQQKPVTKLDDTTGAGAASMSVTARMNLLRVSAKGSVPSPDGPTTMTTTTTGSGSTRSINGIDNKENSTPPIRCGSTSNIKTEMVAAQEALKAAEKTKAAADKQAKELAAALKAALHRAESANAALIKAKERVLELEKVQK